MLKNINYVKERFVPLPKLVEEGKEKELTMNDFSNIDLKGSGSFAKVYYGIRKDTKQECAIKEINKALIKKEHMIPQVIHELNLMYNLNHSNIVKLYTHFEDEDHLSLVMEYAHNGTLHEKLSKQEKGYFPLQVAVKYFKEILEAFKYLHSLSPPVIHRDVKAENILLDKDNVCKIADFGSSAAKEQTRTFCGTLIYMAPEILQKNSYDKSIDIWSLGVLFFEFLTGKSPFSPPNSIIDKIESQNMLTKNILNSSVEFPKDFPILAKDLILKMLNKDPKKRIKLDDILNHELLNEENNETREGRSKSVRVTSFLKTMNINSNSSKVKPLVEIFEDLENLHKENKGKNTKIIDDINKTLINLSSQISEVQTQYGLKKNKFEKLKEIDEIVTNGNNDFSDYIIKCKEKDDKKEELKKIKEDKYKELQKQNEKIQQLEYEILRNREILNSDQVIDIKSKIENLLIKKNELTLKRENLIKLIEEKSNDIKIRHSNNNSPELITNSLKTKDDLLSKFLIKAAYLIKEHKKINRLKNNKTDSKFSEMQKEKREINAEFTRKKEELDRQLAEEFEYTVESLQNDFEHEKNYMEDDFNNQKKLFEKKIQNLTLENYSLSSKINFIEVTFLPRLETLKEHIAQYEKNKMNLHNIIGQYEMKINENNNLIDARNIEIYKYDETLNKKKHKFTVSSFFHSSGETKKKKERTSENSGEKYN